MLSSLVESVKRRTMPINAFLLLCDMRDEAIADPENTLGSFLRENNFPHIQLQDDRIFRHCAVITHLYGIYEEFVASSLQSFLRLMPKYSRFSELEESLKINYRTGIAKIIRDIEKRQFCHLSLLDLLDQYTACLKDTQPWQFVNEALIIHEINLRRSELERLFTVVGIKDFWGLLQNSGRLKIY